MQSKYNLIRMSQTSRTRSSVGERNKSQQALTEVADTGSSEVGPWTLGALPGMSGYAGTSTQALLPSTASDIWRPCSPIGPSIAPHCTRFVSPVGLTIAQRQAQLAAQMPSTAVSGVENVAATADAT